MQSADGLPRNNADFERTDQLLNVIRMNARCGRRIEAAKQLM